SVSTRLGRPPAHTTSSSTADGRNDGGTTSGGRVAAGRSDSSTSRAVTLAHVHCGDDGDDGDDGSSTPPSSPRSGPAVVIVGLTGGIGAGKSTVAALLKEKGAVVIDVDAIGRAVIEPDGRAYQAVVAAFGPSVVDTDGRVDRAALARIVFGNPE